MTLLETARSRQHIVTPDFRDLRPLEAAVNAVKTAFPGYGESQTLSIEDIVRLLTASVSNWDWKGIKVGDLASAIRAVFSGSVTVSDVVLDFLRAELQVTGSQALLAPLCDSYVDAWEKASPNTSWMAEVIGGQLSKLPPRWARCFSIHPEVLDAADAPRLLATKMVRESDPYKWLIDSGIAAPHSGKLMRALHSSWLELLPEPRSKDQIEQIFSWMFPVDQPSLEGEMAAIALGKLLSHWAAANPPSDIRALLLHKIVETYGDPRNQRAEFWSLVSDGCRRIVVRWLAGASMDALLSIIKRSTSNHMWPPRHHFWKGLYDRGLVDEAWVALSPAAYDDAMTMFSETGDEIYRMVSKQTARSRRDTCLLILRIGRHTVLEGSHDFRVHVFQATDPLAPVLYEPEYDAEELILPQFHGNTRIHDAYGSWTGWVEKRVLP